ncbi:LysM peptidoglycan-binding domain-containing protein [Tuanshanicoccus lijuaniae]|uniref:CAP domain-containing protein n=1 Tax=Aerococcaceae bacterium zg-1292 TaxID=2774330 RepID=UPI00193855A0|nr:LysM peptidoglycan-binding domain-containing protein [Aerococcaceae bacterium zg-1292]QQA36549.1 LysM peptidoglycan-binding domain-containing protein [Aerococcaceae bacterium zg-1292]
MTNKRPIMKKVKKHWVTVLLAAAFISTPAISANAQTITIEDYIKETIDNAPSVWKMRTVDDIKQEIQKQKDLKLVEYVVQSGDTLGVIAKTVNTTVDELATLNNIKDIHTLKVGQKLKGVLDKELATINATPNNASVVSNQSSKNTANTTNSTTPMTSTPKITKSASESNTNLKPESKPTPKPEIPTTSEIKPEVKPTPKPEVPTTSETKPEVKPTPKPEVPTTSETKPEVKPTPKPEVPTTSETKPEVKPTPKPEVPTTSETKPEIKPTPKPEVPTTSETKPEVKPTPKPEVPEQPTETPDKPVETPKTTEEETKKDSEVIHELPTETEPEVTDNNTSVDTPSEKPVKPEQPTETPDKPVETPKTTEEETKKDSDVIHELPTETEPEITDNNTSVDTPSEKPVKPEQPTETPDKPVETPKTTEEETKKPTTKHYQTVQVGDIIPSQDGLVRVINTNKTKPFDLNQMQKESEDTRYRKAKSSERNLTTVEPVNNPGSLVNIPTPLPKEFIDDFNQNKILDLNLLNQHFVNFVNQLRASNNIKPLQYNEDVQYFATKRAQEMQPFHSPLVNGQAHKRPDGRNWATVFEEKPSDWGAAAENSASITLNGNYYKSLSEKYIAENLFNQWSNSPGHRQNLLDPTLEYTAVGINMNGNKVVNHQFRYDSMYAFQTLAKKATKPSQVPDNELEDFLRENFPEMYAGTASAPRNEDSTTETTPLPDETTKETSAKVMETTSEEAVSEDLVEPTVDPVAEPTSETITEQATESVTDTLLETTESEKTIKSEETTESENVTETIPDTSTIEDTTITE